ncbi:hypothetical protein J2S02_003368 [Metabacillus niabensis]|uniref:Uncharacterized protein n=1 Tax=Metabacillus niabensis TaxID=324854 RepID=A0ABT9Z435_9BACI|nr:hypothetical protein [Metabacillus niabensis]
MKLCSSIYCYHLILWSSYSFVSWLSKKDSLISKTILLTIFFYLAYLIAFTLIKSKRDAIVITLVSLSIFMLCLQIILHLFIK